MEQYPMDWNISSYVEKHNDKFDITEYCGLFMTIRTSTSHGIEIIA